MDSHERDSSKRYAFPICPSYPCQHGLGISVIAFKVVPDQSKDILILENTFHEKGSPARHLHYEQEEWFYAVEGEFLISNQQPAAWKNLSLEGTEN